MDWWLIGGVVGGMVLLVAWSLMVMAARGDEDIERLMAASGPGAQKTSQGEKPS